MEFALFAPTRRATLAFPSPFLRNEATVLEIESGDPGGAQSSQAREVTSFESGFKHELIAFHDAVVAGTRPPTTGADTRRDIALCQAIIECGRTGRPIDRPTGAA
jgi:predicted dehydrogenase